MDATLCLNTSGRPYYGEGAAEGMLDDVAIEAGVSPLSVIYQRDEEYAKQQS